MKNKMLVISVVLALLLVGTGVAVYKVITKPVPKSTTDDGLQQEILPPVDSSVTVVVKKSSTADNTIAIQASGLAGKMKSVAYELTYDSQGLIKGVNSGSKPIDTTGKDTFERDVYLGTCSRNVCKPDVGITKVTVVLEFTDTNGKKSQFSKDYEL